jgi:hypothetical protein
MTLGWQSVDMMLDTMSYVELQDWTTFFSIEPFPEERADFRVAHAMALLANINIDPDKHAPVTYSDFMPDYWKNIGVKEEALHAEKQNELYNAVFSMNAQLGTIVHRSEVAK